MEILERFGSFINKFDEEIRIEDTSDLVNTLEKYVDTDKKVLKVWFHEQHFAIIDIDRMTMKLVKETKRSKYGFKAISHYRYNSFEQMVNSINTLLKNIKYKEDKQEAKKKAKQNFENPYKVGDILYDSWGYEQTNVSFYQIVKVSDKSVWIRKIGEEQVETDEFGPFGGRKKPIKDKFVSDEIIRKPVNIYLSNSGEPVPYLRSTHGSLSKYDKGDKGIYYSWGY